jgi:topoisomerase-4 subunit A
VLLTDQVYPRIKVTFGGNDSFREPLEIEAEEFVGVKGFKARGKRLTTYAIGSIEELEPLRFPEVPEDNGAEGDREAEADGGEAPDEENLDPDKGKSERQIRDEITGQLSLFDDEDL